MPLEPKRNWPRWQRFVLVGFGWLGVVIAIVRIYSLDFIGSLEVIALSFVLGDFIKKIFLIKTKKGLRMGFVKEAWTIDFPELASFGYVAGFILGAAVADLLVAGYDFGTFVGRHIALVIVLGVITPILLTLGFRNEAREGRSDPEREESRDTLIIASPYDSPMAISVDPFGLLKDYLSKRKEQKELDSLVGKFYRVKSNGATTDGYLVRFARISDSMVLILDTTNGQVNIPLDKVEVFHQVAQRDKLTELIELTKAIDGSRSTHLSWIIGAAIPVREAARKWFDDESRRLEHQLRLLIDLFPHREYKSLADTLEAIESDFDESIVMLDGILKLVEQRKVTQIKEIYHEGRTAKLPGEQVEPDIVVAILGMFNAANRLDGLTKRINAVVDGITDTVTITKILSNDS